MTATDMTEAPAVERSAEQQYPQVEWCDDCWASCFDRLGVEGCSKFHETGCDHTTCYAATREMGD